MPCQGHSPDKDPGLLTSDSECCPTTFRLLPLHKPQIGKKVILLPPKAHGSLENLTLGNWTQAGRQPAGSRFQALPGHGKAVPNPLGTHPWAPIGSLSHHYCWPQGSSHPVCFWTLLLGNFTGSKSVDRKLFLLLVVVFWGFFGFKSLAFLELFSPFLCPFAKTKDFNKAKKKLASIKQVQGQPNSV